MSIVKLAETVKPTGLPFSRVQHHLQGADISA
jgi:hypothetical protein